MTQKTRKYADGLAFDERFTDEHWKEVVASFNKDYWEEEDDPTN